MVPEFKTPESYQAEKSTRAILVSFLEVNGFTGVEVPTSDEKCLNCEGFSLNFFPQQNPKCT